jgi:EAL domain-containing protein (putative c-di-GMP-specific phosphodiesterase class I)
LRILGHDAENETAMSALSAPDRHRLPPTSTVLHLQPRRRLADDRLTAGEAASPRAGGRFASPLLDPYGPALRQIAGLGGDWADATIAVALPAGEAWPAHLIACVSAALACSGLPATRLDLVLPEAVLSDIDSDALLALSALRDIGVGLCIDGFGAGLGGLTLLKRLPLTSLKLARTLVRSLPDDREDAAIVRAVIATAQAIGLIVIGDGIETEAQRAFLAHCGCDEGQGTLFGPSLAFACALAA